MALTGGPLLSYPRSERGPAHAFRSPARGPGLGIRLGIGIALGDDVGRAVARTAAVRNVLNVLRRAVSPRVGL